MTAPTIESRLLAVEFLVGNILLRDFSPTALKQFADGHRQVASANAEAAAIVPMPDMTASAELHGALAVFFEKTATLKSAPPADARP